MHTIICTDFIVTVKYVENILFAFTIKVLFLNLPSTDKVYLQLLRQNFEYRV